MTSKAPFTKTEIISPEEIILKEVYSITINPSDKRQYFDCIDRVELLVEYMEKEICKVPNVDLKLHMEISRTGRLHFHGTISFNSYETITRFYKCHIHQWLEWGHINIDTIKDKEVWKTYCEKSKNIINEVLETSKIIKRYHKVKIDKNGIAHKPYFADL